jgi:hypothetical protein
MIAHHAAPRGGTPEIGRSVADGLRLRSGSQSARRRTRHHTQAASGALATRRKKPHHHPTSRMPVLGDGGPVGSPTAFMPGILPHPQPRVRN